MGAMRPRAPFFRENRRLTPNIVEAPGVVLDLQTASSSECAEQLGDGPDRADIDPLVGWAEHVDVFPFFLGAIITTERQTGQPLSSKASASPKSGRCQGSSRSGLPSQRSSDWIRWVLQKSAKCRTSEPAA